MIGRPIFDYPPERKAPEGEGCITCGIVLEADAIDSQHCSPEFRTCTACAKARRQIRFDLGPQGRTSTAKEI